MDFSDGIVLPPIRNVVIADVRVVCQSGVGLGNGDLLRSEGQIAAPGGCVQFGRTEFHSGFVIAVLGIDGVLEPLLIDVGRERGRHIHVLAAEVEHFRGIVHGVIEAHVFIDLVHFLLHHGEAEQRRLRNALLRRFLHL